MHVVCLNVLHHNVRRYNDYKNDPLSRCNCTPPYSAENAMSVRGDLNPPNGTYPFSRIGHRDHVGYDTKVRQLAYLTAFSSRFDRPFSLFFGLSSQW